VCTWPPSGIACWLACLRSVPKLGVAVAFRRRQSAPWHPKWQQRGDPQGWSDAKAPMAYPASSNSAPGSAPEPDERPQPHPRGLVGERRWHAVAEIGGSGHSGVGRSLLPGQRVLVGMAGPGRLGGVTLLLAGRGDEPARDLVVGGRPGVESSGDGLRGWLRLHPTDSRRWRWAAGHVNEPVRVPRTGAACRTRVHLWTSADGATWTDLVLPDDLSKMTDGLAPDRAGSPWLIGGVSCERLDDGSDACQPRLWAAAKPGDWRALTLPGSADLSVDEARMARSDLGQVVTAWRWASEADEARRSADDDRRERLIARVNSLGRGPSRRRLSPQGDRPTLWNVMKKGLAGDNVGLSKQPAPGGRPGHVIRRIGPVTPEARCARAR